MIVQLKDGTDTAAALASINSAVAAATRRGETRNYSNTFTGFALSAPPSARWMRSAALSGVQTPSLIARLKSATMQTNSDDAGSGSATTASRSQHPDDLSADHDAR